MPQPLVLHVVRHGEVYNPQKVFYGRLPNFGLSQTGQMQAQAAAKYLANAPLVAIYASPQQRAQETASYIASHHPSLTVKTDERLAEVLSPYDGTPLDTLHATGFDIYTGNQPPYETVADLRARVQAFVRSLTDLHAGGQVVAVTHGDIVLSALALAFGLPSHDLGKERLLKLGFAVSYPATASIVTLTFHDPTLIASPAWAYHCPY
jgi:broad specificity phosphatase PhoE